MDLSVPADFYARRAERLIQDAEERNLLDLGFKVSPDVQAATLDYTRRIRKGWSLWAHGEAGLTHGEWFALGLGGLRIRF